jgi:hypothetical protein
LAQGSRGPRCGVGRRSGGTAERRSRTPASSRRPMRGFPERTREWGGAPVPTGPAAAVHQRVQGRGGSEGRRRSGVGRVGPGGYGSGAGEAEAGQTARKVSALILRQSMDRESGWGGVGRYHSATQHRKLLYAYRVARTLSMIEASRRPAAFGTVVRSAAAGR